MISKGVKYPWGTLEESLAIIAYQRQAEVDFLRLIVIVNAIIQVGNRIGAAVTGSEMPQGDSLKKSLDALEKLMMPHRAEERDSRAKEVRKILEREVNRGPLQIKVVGEDKKRRGTVRIRRKT